MSLKIECQNRIAKLQETLRQGNLDGALIVYAIDIYYFTGTRQNSTLWIPAQGEPILLVRKSFVRAQSEACIDDIRPFPRSKDFAPLFAGQQNIGITFDVLPVQQYNYYKNLLPEVNFVDISAQNRTMRSIKSEWELERMREAGAKQCQVFASVPEFLRPGMREIDLAAEFEMRLRKLGCEGIVRMRAFNQEMFMGLAISGAEHGRGCFDGAVTGQGMSAATPYGASTKVIAAGEPVLIDYAGVFDGYTVDATRMFVCGQLDPTLVNAFAVSCEIQDAVAAKLRPGVICEDLYELSLEMAQAAGLADYYMGTPGENAKFVGHGVGLQLDEMPVLAPGFDQSLVAGQTIAIEPKFVFPGLGPIGIENTFAVTEASGEKLTVLADDLIVI